MSAQYALRVVVIVQLESILMEWNVYNVIQIVSTALVLVSNAQNVCLDNILMPQIHARLANLLV